jgi:conjugal transfer pilus assembly protein TraU
MKRRRLHFLFAFLLLNPMLSAKASLCEGRWVNPITDICWRCLFPISLGNIGLNGSELPDTRNPSSPIQLCPAPPPLFQRIGLAIGFWEPFAMTDVTRSPMCMVNMGGFTIPIGQIGMGKGTKGANENPGGMYHVHWYKYPLISWLNILTTIAACKAVNMTLAISRNLTRCGWTTIWHFSPIQKQCCLATVSPS